MKKMDKHILLTPEDIHPLDYDLSMGYINKEEYDEEIQRIVDERMINNISNGK